MPRMDVFHLVLLVGRLDTDRSCDLLISMSLEAGQRINLRLMMSDAHTSTSCRHCDREREQA